MDDEFRWPGRTNLELVFRIRGTDVSPEALTASTGLTPARTFHVGEARGRSATMAGWEWRSEPWTDLDTDPLMAAVLEVLRPHEAVFAKCSADGAEIFLTVVGSIYGEVIATFDEAESRRFSAGTRERFVPFFSGDRVAISLEPDFMGFLSRIGAGFHTHIDAELDNQAR